MKYSVCPDCGHVVSWPELAPIDKAPCTKCKSKRKRPVARDKDTADTLGAYAAREAKKNAKK